MSLSTLIKFSTLTAGTLGLVTLSSFGNAAIAASLTNGGFESGLTGWTVVDQAGGWGSWYSTTGGSAPTTGLSILGASEGNKFAVTDQFGAGSHVLFQDISLEADMTHTLSFKWSSKNWENAMYNPETMNKDAWPNQQFRVDIVSTLFSDWFGSSSNTGVIASILAPVAPSSSGWNDVSFDLTPWAGSSVRLAFREVDNQYYFNAGVDDVSIESVPEPITIIGSLMALGGMASARSRQKGKKPA